MKAQKMNSILMSCLILGAPLAKAAVCSEQQPALKYYDLANKSFGGAANQVYVNSNHEMVSGAGGSVIQVFNSQGIAIEQYDISSKYKTSFDDVLITDDGMLVAYSKNKNTFYLPRTGQEVQSSGAAVKSQILDLSGHGLVYLDNDNQLVKISKNFAVEWSAKLPLSSRAQSLSLEKRAGPFVVDSNKIFVFYNGDGFFYDAKGALLKKVSLEKFDSAVPLAVSHLRNGRVVISGLEAQTLIVDGASLNIHSISRSSSFGHEGFFGLYFAGAQDEFLSFVGRDGDLYFYNLEAQLVYKTKFEPSQYLTKAATVGSKLVLINDQGKIYAVDPQNKENKEIAQIETGWLGTPTISSNIDQKHFSVVYKKDFYVFDLNGQKTVEKRNFFTDFNPVKIVQLDQDNYLIRGIGQAAVFSATSSYYQKEFVGYGDAQGGRNAIDFKLSSSAIVPTFENAGAGKSYRFHSNYIFSLQKCSAAQ